MKFKTVAAAALLAISPLAAQAGSVDAGAGEPVVIPAGDDVLSLGSLGSFGLGGGAAAAVAALTILAIVASSDDTTSP